MPTTSWIIGAATDCQVVVDAPTVSSRHCRLTKTGHRVLLEDLGSTNGTFLNGRRLTRPTRVNDSDQIRLGQDVELPGDVGSLLEQLDQELTEAKSSWWKIGVPAWKFRVPANRRTLAALMMVVGLLCFTFGQRSQSSSIVPAPESPRVSGEELADSVNQPSSTDGDPETPVSEPNETEEVSPVSQTPGHANEPPVTVEHQPERAPLVPVDPLQAVYSVLIQDAKNAQAKSVGTAWAATNSLLVTSGSVVHFLQSRRPGSVTVVVRCEASGQEFAVIETTLHPDYARQVPEIQRAVQNMIARGGRIDAAKREGSKPSAQFDADFAASMSELGQATERSSYFDLGSLKVDGVLPVLLPIATNDAVNTLKRPIAVLGGVSESSSDVSGPVSQQPQWLTCDRGAMLSGEQGHESLFRWQWTTKRNHTDRDWTGSPLLDGSGRVIGVFSRPTPPSAPENDPAVDRLDAVSIQQLRSLIAELFD